MKTSFILGSSLSMFVGGLILGAYVHPGFFAAELVGAVILWYVLD